MISDAIEIRLTRKERAVLEARLPAGSTEQRQLLRTRIVLEAAEGLGTREIAYDADHGQLVAGSFCSSKA